MVSFDPAATYKYGTNKYTVTDNKGVTQTITTSTPPGNTAALKLFWVSLNSRYVDAAIGQFKYPMSYEGQSSSAELLFPERAYSSRYFGDTYDMGFRLEKKLDWFKYQVFLLNGSGQNQVDTNIQKDLSVRVELTPIPGMTLGAAGLTSLSRRTEQATTKDTGEFFGRLNTAGFLVQGELIWGKVGSTASGVERTKAAGRYATVGYTIAGKLQPVIRYGYLNTDKTVTLGNASTYALYAPFGVATDEVRSYEVGLNYYLQSNSLKLQAAYGYFDFDNVPALQEFTLSAQVAL
jgi:phosphate-selective porin